VLGLVRWVCEQSITAARRSGVPGGDCFGDCVVLLPRNQSGGAAGSEPASLHSWLGISGWSSGPKGATDSQPAFRPSGGFGSEDRLILPGDDLEVLVVEDASFNGTYKVRRGGYIIVPAVGRVQVAGMTMNDAETAVRKALRRRNWGMRLSR